MENKNDIDIVELNRKLATNALGIAIKAMGDIGALKLEITNQISESTGEPMSEITKRLNQRSVELVKHQLDKLSVLLGPSFEDLSELFDNSNTSHA